MVPFGSPKVAQGGVQSTIPLRQDVSDYHDRPVSSQEQESSSPSEHKRPGVVDANHRSADDSAPPADLREANCRTPVKSAEKTPRTAPYDAQYEQFTSFDPDDPWLADPEYLPMPSGEESFIEYPTESYAQNMQEPYPWDPEQLEQLAKYDLSNHDPPILSSTTDSGASIQTGTSSHMDPDSAQPQQASDWSCQFNVSPSILQPDNMIPTSMLETGHISGEAKIWRVGELSKFPCPISCRPCDQARTSRLSNLE